MKKKTKGIMLILGLLLLVGAMTCGVVVYQYYQPIEVEIFDYVKIKQSGGNDEVEVKTTLTKYVVPTDEISEETAKRLNQFLIEFQVTQDKATNLANGDLVTIQLKNAEELTKKHRIKPVKTEITYTVENAPTVPKKWGDFTEYQERFLSDSYTLMENIQSDVMLSENEATQKQFGKNIMSGFTLIGIEVYEQQESRRQTCFPKSETVVETYGCGEVALLFHYKANLINYLYYPDGNDFYGFSEFEKVYKTVDGQLEYDHVSSRRKDKFMLESTAKEALEARGYQATGIFL